MSLILTPAYGRDYKKKADVITDFDSGKDFIIANLDHPYSGKPCNKQDLGAENIVFRYGKLRKTCCHFNKDN